MKAATDKKDVQTLRMSQKESIELINSCQNSPLHCFVTVCASMNVEMQQRIINDINFAIFIGVCFGMGFWTEMRIIKLIIFVLQIIFLSKFKAYFDQNFEYQDVMSRNFDQKSH